MKHPHHMTMSELIALPVIEQAAELTRLADAEQYQFGGAFTDPDGHLWHTVLGDNGWARYAACLVLFVDAGCAGLHLSDPVVASAYSGRASLASVLRAFG